MTEMKGEMFPVVDETQNCSLMPLHERRSERSDACMAEDVPYSVPCVEGETGYTAPDKTPVRGANPSRRKGRRIRRQAARERRRRERCEALGGLDGVFSYHNLLFAGKKCCRNVRWKQSVQRFEAHLFSGTAVQTRALRSETYTFSPYVRFTLRERGKIRSIDAPRIQDRQAEKVFTQKVLIPLYLPGMIWNNGASLPGKGLAFSVREMKAELREHYRKYGRSGGVIITDGRKFFPTADHAHILARHERLISDTGLKRYADEVVGTVPGDRGMPLGVEPSQAEMVAFPNPMDSYMKCQLSLHGYGHYMDDFYALVPPNVDWHDVLRTMYAQAERCGFELNESKTKYIPLTRSFRCCKAKYILTETGKVIVRANWKAAPRDRRKLSAFKEKIERGEMTWMDLWTSVNGMTAYLSAYSEHNAVLDLRRRFYAKFGFSCETIEPFRARQERHNEGREKWNTFAIRGSVADPSAEM